MAKLYWDDNNINTDCQNVQYVYSMHGEPITHKSIISKRLYIQVYG
jgi:hypothetical protein